MFLENRICWLKIGIVVFIEGCIFYVKFIKLFSVFLFLINWFFFCILNGKIEFYNEIMK